MQAQAFTLQPNEIRTTKQYCLNDRRLFYFPSKAIKAHNKISECQQSISESHLDQTILGGKTKRANTE